MGQRFTTKRVARQVFWMLHWRCGTESYCAPREIVWTMAAPEGMSVTGLVSTATFG